jgi:hypothetical protein
VNIFFDEIKAPTSSPGGLARGKISSKSIGALERHAKGVFAVFGENLETVSFFFDEIKASNSSLCGPFMCKISSQSVKAFGRNSTGRFRFHWPKSCFNWPKTKSHRPFNMGLFSQILQNVLLP